jgi:hypothetical protein
MSAKMTDTDKNLEHVSYINNRGIALDDYGNEYRDEDGMVYFVPMEMRKYFKVIEEN